MVKHGRWRSWWKTAWHDQRGMSDYVALAIATPLMIMGFLGGSAVVETVSAQAALHTAAGIADRALVADGCLTSNALQAMSTTLQAAHMSPSRMTLATTTGSSGLYGTRGLAVNVSYAVPLTIPGTPWRITSRKATAQVSDDQSQYVPYANTRTSACASSSAVASVFQGAAGTSGGGSSVTLPPEATAVSETVTPSPGQVGSALTVSGMVTDNGSPMANTAVSVAVGTQVTQTATTNVQGQYSATLIPTQAGSVAVDVTAGPATNSDTVTIQPLAPASITLNVPDSVTVGAAFAIQGSVLSANGQPVADGTPVTVSSNASGEIAAQTVTTSGGAFTVDVPNGLTALSPNPVTVTATAGAISQTADIAPAPGQPQQVTLSVTPTKGPAGGTWSVSGTVTGPDGTPVAPGTTVTLTSSVANAATMPSFTTTSTGTFAGTVTLTTAGSQALTATAGTVQSAPVSMTVTPSAPTQVENLTATPNPVNLGATTVISGMVLDAYGNPEPAGLALTLTSPAWKNAVTTTTTAGGTFSTAVSFNQSGNQVVQVAVGSTPLQNGTITVAVNAQGAYTLQAAQSSTTMTAGQTQTVTWTLTNSQGNPVDGIPLTVAANPSTDVTLSATSATTNSQGQATITVSTTQAGTLTVTATAQTSPNTTGTATWIVHPAAPQTVDPPTISPSVVQSTQDGGTVIPVATGLALDSYGNPVANATVSVTGGWDPGVTFTGTADAEGYFSIPLTPVDVGGPYFPTITVSDSAGSNTTMYTNTSLTVVTQVYVLTLTPTSGSTITPAGTPYGVQVALSAYGPHSGAPIPDATVTLQVSSSDTGYWTAGTTTPTPTSSQTLTLTTNSDGTALAEVALEPNTGQQVITGTWATDNTIGTLDILVTANTPSQVMWDSLLPNPVTAGHSFVFATPLLDAYGFAVSNGQSGSWQFDHTTGTAVTQTWNGLEGVVTASSTPTTAGSYPVSLSLDGQTYTSAAVTVNPGPVQFLYPVLGPANNSGGTLLPGGTWNSSTDTMSYGTLPASDGQTVSLRFTAYDAYDNAVADWSTGTITCTASGGGSCPALTQPSQPTNSAGQSGWANEGSFSPGSYRLTVTPSGSDIASSVWTTHLVFTIPTPYHIMQNLSWGTGYYNNTLYNLGANTWNAIWTGSNGINYSEGSFSIQPVHTMGQLYWMSSNSMYGSTPPSVYSESPRTNTSLPDMALNDAFNTFVAGLTSTEQQSLTVHLAGGPNTLALGGDYYQPGTLSYDGRTYSTQQPVFFALMQTASGVTGPYTTMPSVFTPWSFNDYWTSGVVSYSTPLAVNMQSTVMPEGTTVNLYVSQGHVYMGVAAEGMIWAQSGSSNWAFASAVEQVNPSGQWTSLAADSNTTVLSSSTSGTSDPLTVGAYHAATWALTYKWSETGDDNGIVQWGWLPDSMTVSTSGAPTLQYDNLITSSSTYAYTDVSMTPPWAISQKAGTLWIYGDNVLSSISSTGSVQSYPTDIAGSPDDMNVVASEQHNAAAIAAMTYAGGQVRHQYYPPTYDIGALVHGTWIWNNGVQDFGWLVWDGSFVP